MSEADGTVSNDPEFPVAPREMPHISKSRVTSYIKCPRKFYYTYVKGLSEPETFYTKRGSRVHLTFEGYYENVAALDELPRLVDLVELLPADVLLWGDFTEPFISNFLVFEARRLEAAMEADDPLEAFKPVGIEEELFLEDPPVDGSPPWFGYADVILPAASVTEAPTDEGVVIIDFKTGNSEKAEKYKNKPGSVLDELEFYSVMVEDEYDVAAIIGYYPDNDHAIVSTPTEKRRNRILETVAEMVQLGTDEADYQLNENPLCKWGPDDDAQCSFYGFPCDSTWGTADGPGPTFD